MHSTNNISTKYSGLEDALMFPSSSTLPDLDLAANLIDGTMFTKKQLQLQVRMRHILASAS